MKRPIKPMRKREGLRETLQRIAGLRQLCGRHDGTRRNDETTGNGGWMDGGVETTGWGGRDGVVLL